MWNSKLCMAACLWLAALVAGCGGEPLDDSDPQAIPENPDEIERGIFSNPLDVASNKALFTATELALAKQFYIGNIVDNTGAWDKKLSFTAEPGVKKNPELARVIKANALYTTLFNKPLVTLAVKLAKFGTPVFRFGKGQNPNRRMSIWAGMHGNEPEANLSTLRWMNEFVETGAYKTFDGSLLVFPFAMPISTRSNVRDFLGSDPNRLSETASLYTSLPRDPASATFQRTLNTKFKNPAVHFLHKAKYKYLTPWVLDVHSGSGVGVRRGHFFCGNTAATTWAKFIASKVAGKTMDGKPITTAGSTAVSLQLPTMRKIGSLAAYGYKLNIITLEVEIDNAVFSTEKAAQLEYELIKAAVSYKP